MEITEMQFEKVGEEWCLAVGGSDWKRFVPVPPQMIADLNPPCPHAKAVELVHEADHWVQKVQEFKKSIRGVETAVS